MRIISHRGNLNGPSDQENTIQAIHKALILGYDVEIDIWLEHGKLFLGHDYGQYHVQDESILKDERVWIHAKNLEALQYLLANFSECNIFWHQNDDYTLTSKGIIWTYPRKKVCEKSVIVALDPVDIEMSLKKDIIGICTDYPIYLKEGLFKREVEKRYAEYVYNCACVEETALSFREFIDAISDGKCEICLVHPEEKCGCKKLNLDNKLDTMSK